MILLRSLQFIFFDVLHSIVYFPVWWYTTGAKNVLLAIWREILSFAQSLRLSTLFRFLFKPMFGQYDTWGRIISVGVRIVHFFILLTGTIIYTIVLSLGFVVWLLMPLFVVWQIGFHAGVLDSFFIV